MTVKHFIERFGLSGHTTLSHLAMVAGFYFQGMRAKYTSQLLYLALQLVGGRKRDSVESTCSALTLANSDMGRGQVSAALSNFKSFATVLGPPIAGKVYTYGQSIGQPGLLYRMIAVLIVLAEVVHRSLGRKLETLVK